MKQEDYVTFDVAKLLKEKGYDFVEKKAYLEEDYHSYAKCGDLIDTFHFCNIMCPMEIMCFAPTLYQAAKWLREKHGVIVDIDTDYYDGFIFTYQAWTLGKISEKESFDSYEQALNEGIKEALNMI